MNDEEIEPLLAAAVSSYRQIPNRIKVGTAIEAVTGKRVIALSSDAADGQLLGDIGKTAETLIADSQGTPIGTTRLNELGNAIEEPLFAACSKVGLPATWPRRANGSGGRSGYPNIAIDIDGMRPTYLEAKVVGAGSENSSFRSFYLSPSDNPKVGVDARHLLLAFKHRRWADGADGLERYSLMTYKIVDLSRVVGKIKFEYQSSNKDMYVGDAVVASG